MLAVVDDVASIASFADQGPEKHALWPFPRAMSGGEHHTWGNEGTGANGLIAMHQRDDGRITFVNHGVRDRLPHAA